MFMRRKRRIEKVKRRYKMNEKYHNINMNCYRKYKVVNRIENKVITFKIVIKIKEIKIYREINKFQLNLYQNRIIMLSSIENTVI